MAKNFSAVLDIGSSKITVMVGSEVFGGDFVVFGKSSAQYAGFVDGEFLEEEKLAGVIGKVIENVELQTCFSIKKLTVSIPAEFCICRNRKLTITFSQSKKLSQDLIDEIYSNAVEYVENHTLVSSQPIYNLVDDGRKIVDACGVKTTKLTSLVSTVYASNKFINTINSSLSQLAIQKVNYVPSAVAQTEYLLSAEKNMSACVLIDIGYITTEVSVAKGGGLLLLGSFSMGGGHITADLSECLKIGFSDAENLKRRMILSLQASPNDVYEIESVQANGTKTFFMKTANQIVFDRLDVIAYLIKKVISQVEDTEHMRFFLTGGGITCVKGAKEYLASRLSANIEIVTPNLAEFNKPNQSSSIALLSYSLKNFQKKHVGMLAKLKK